MKDAAPQTIHLADYTPFGFIAEHVSLTFRLHPTRTRVISRIAFRPNPDAKNHDFFLHGQDLKLISAMIDGNAVDPAVSHEGLRCEVPDEAFVWECEVEIDPQGNTALEGLYMSNGMFCTQCEAEGFRKITYYPDRPDVMSVFDVRIESDLPVLLSNGNTVEAGDGYAVWSDPWHKPAYLFALVAGDLRAQNATFKTMSGREVDLNIWVRPGPDEAKCDFGMDALRRSMAWDEEIYGREYDLDVFNIVAVDDFNMGAMENKGLNIFNSSCVLCSPQTATDADFERIEAIIAHEYFHNWTGNRITCRDWFQLCLKEGLTVFRDQQFTGDMRGHAVKRIEDAQMMRAVQFREDAGPLAHPVRPESFVEINNFYTVTVYEKGAELIAMLKLLVGDAAYAQALDLYFARHDGEAATIEDWLTVFEEVTGRDLAQFQLWYSQAGTPRLAIEDDFADGTYTLRVTQSVPPTPGQPDKYPMVIPLAVGLLGSDGADLIGARVLELTKREHVFTFDGLDARPVASLLRGFSAPVIIDRDPSEAELAFQLHHDPDTFNRWDAGRQLAMSVLTGMLEGRPPSAVFLDGLARVLRDDTLDPAYRALMLSLPGQGETARVVRDAGGIPDPDLIHATHEALMLHIAQHLKDHLTSVYAAMQVPGPYSPDAKAAGCRRLGNQVLSLISRLDGGRSAQDQFAAADNMTQQISALSSLLQIAKGAPELEAFAVQWEADRLVMDKWFGLQIAAAAPDKAVALAQELSAHPAFTMANPNRFRAVFGALARHPAGFHRADGSGYGLLAQWLIKLDPVNPQTTARMVGAFEDLAMFGPDRERLMREALGRIAGAQGLSRDTGEMIDRLLG